MIAGIGVDIVDVERIAGVIARRGDKFINRVFTEQEISYCRRCAHPHERFAARFAAKEAALKALRVGWQNGTRFKDVEVSSDELGAPHVQLRGRAVEISREMGITRMHLTLSHDRRYAVAYVVAEV